MNPLANWCRFLLLYGCCSIFVTGCASKKPSEREMKEQIQSELLRMTAGELFEVGAIKLQQGAIDADNAYRVTAISTLVFKRSIAQHVDWMLQNTKPPKGMEPGELKRALVEKLAAKFGNLQPGMSGTYRQSFVFYKRNFGWRLQSDGDDKPVF